MTGITVPEEDCLPQCRKSISCPVLIVCTFEDSTGLFVFFHSGGIKRTDFDDCLPYRAYAFVSFYNVKMVVLPVLKGWSDPPFFFLAVVETRPSVTLSVSAFPAVLTSVIVTFLLVGQVVILLMDEFMFFRLYAYADVGISASQQTSTG